MTDRWRAMPVQWVRDPRWNALRLDCVRVLYALHAYSRTGIVEYLGPSQLATVLGLRIRTTRMRSAIEDLEAAEFVTCEPERLVLRDHVHFKRGKSKRDPSRIRTGSQPDPNRTGVSEGSREVEPAPIAHAGDKENPIGFSKKGSGDGRPLEGWRPSLSKDQKEDLDRRVEALSRFVNRE